MIFTVMKISTYLKSKNFCFVTFCYKDLENKTHYQNKNINDSRELNLVIANIISEVIINLIWWINKWILCNWWVYYKYKIELKRKRDLFKNYFAKKKICLIILWSIYNIYNSYIAIKAKLCSYIVFLFKL